MLKKQNAADMCNLQSLADVRAVTVFIGNFGELQWHDGIYYAEYAIHVFFPSSFTDDLITSYVSVYNDAGIFKDCQKLELNPLCRKK